MSLRTLPILFINLGGEMMYILAQRLRAQNIPSEKSVKVLHDIVSTMFNKRFMDELFKPQELYSKKAMRTVFDKLAHASIMRLNSASMDKLYDLMTMAFKYQVSMVLQPSHLLLVTLNHMDAIRDFVVESPSITLQVENVYSLLQQNYGNMALGEFCLVRQTLLCFFQDMHIRVSIFLKDKVQNINGRFAIPTSGAVPNGTEVPGTIRLFNGEGELIKTTHFSPGGNYYCSVKEGSTENLGDRITNLGKNMYILSKPIDTTTINEGLSEQGSEFGLSKDNSQSNVLAKAELNLLAQLVGSLAGEKKVPEFHLNLFNTDEEEEEAASLAPPSEPRSEVITIDASKTNYGSTLEKLVGDMSVDDGKEHTVTNKGEDLLTLMDSADK